jgi:predicted NBD/HSP70 family sugar kinase
MNSAWVRRLNAVRLMQALRRRPGSSQRELAALTGLDKATVSAVTAQLVQAGLVERSAAATGAPRLGRPAVALRIPQSAGMVFGIRLEPDRVALVAADLGGMVLARDAEPGAAGPEAMMQALRRGAERLEARLAPLPLRAVGIGVPALIDRAGRLIFAPNLGWRDVPLAAHVAAIFAAPVAIENDSKAAAIAERAFGSCAGVDDFIYVSGHSGVGGAIFAGGALYRGGDGLAGEIGHVKVMQGGRACACGGRGCLEAYASEPALVATLAARGRAAAGLGEAAALAQAGDAVVLELLAETGRLAGRALAPLVNALNPSRLVFGGSLAAVTPWMLPALRAELAEAALEELAGALLIAASPLGTDAVPMGGVALALQRLDAELLEAPARIARRAGP